MLTGKVMPCLFVCLFVCLFAKCFLPMMVWPTRFDRVGIARDIAPVLVPNTKELQNSRELVTFKRGHY